MTAPTHTDKNDGRPHACVFSTHRYTDVRIFNRQILSLVQAGWRVTYVSVGDDYGQEMISGVKVIKVPLGKGLRQRIERTWQVFRTAVAQRADVYQFHDPEFLPLAAAARCLLGKPFIYDIHEFYAIKFPLRLPTRFGIRKLGAATIAWLELILGRICGAVSAVYGEHVSLFRRAGCLAAWTPNYASLSDFTIPELTQEDWQRRRDTVVFIGTLDRSKGALVMVDIAKILKERRPQINIRVCRRFLVPKQEQEMLEYACERGAEDAITWLPNVKGHELPGIVRQAMVGLSPLQDVGQYRVAVPTKFFEYMSQGLAIVASDLPPSREYVLGPGCGVVVPPADAQAYADAVMDLLDHPEQAREMGLKGQQAFREQYNWQAIAPQLCSLYWQLCPTSKRGFLKPATARESLHAHHNQR